MESAGKFYAVYTIIAAAYTSVELALISPDTTLAEGETAILACVGYSQPYVEVTWMHRGAPVMNSSLVTTYQEDTVEMGLPFRQSFLQLCSVSLANSGEYTCIVTNGLSSVNSTVQLTISSKDIIL